DNSLSTNTGAVYVFRLIHDVWTQEAKLVASPPLDNPAVLGSSVALDGSILAAGAPWYDQPIGDTGMVYVFELAGGTWTQTAKLLNASPMHAELFGNALALSGDTLLASAEGWGCNGPPGTCTGAAFVFRKVGGAWGQEAMLTANDGLAKD